MKETFLRITALSCAILLTASMLAGCGGKEPVKEAGKTTVEETKKEPVKLTYISADAGRIDKEDNPVVTEIEKRTNVKLDITLVPQAEFTNKFNMLVAANSIPDIMRLSSLGFFEYIPQGIFLELGKQLETNGPNMKKFIPKEAWENVTVDKKLYAIPNYNWPGKNNFYMRQDWLDNLGLKAPTNLEELEQVLKKFTFNDPDKNGKNDTYGITTCETITGIPGTFYSIFGAFGFAPKSYYEKEGKVYAPLITPQYKESLEYISRLYKEDKVVDPDLFIIKTDQALQNLVQGRSGSFGGWWSIAESSLMDQMKMKSVNPEAKWAILNTIKGKNGEYGFPARGIVSATASISAKCKNPDEAFKFLDYLVSDEGATLSNLGMKDVHYIEKDGKFVKRTPEGDKAMDEKWLDVLSQTVFRVDINQNIYKVNNPSYWPSIEAARDAKLYTNLFEGLTTSESQRLSSDLSKFELEWFVKFVTGKEPLSSFDEYVKQWKSKGGKEVMDSYVKAYNKNTGKNLIFAN